LLQSPLIDDGQAVGKRERFLLIVRDQNHGHAKRPLQLLQFNLQAFAQLPVQCAQGLVQQHDRWPKYQCTRKRDPLLLTT
jgi:hypothetical protein